MTRTEPRHVVQFEQCLAAVKPSAGGDNEPTDIVVRIDSTTICGSDLHILNGDDPTVEQGRVLGHEVVGTVVEVGNAVTSLRADDRVLVPAITPAGHVMGFSTMPLLAWSRAWQKSGRNRKCVANLT